VAATFSLALSRLEADSPAAAGLIRLLAFLDPEPVPLDLLLADDGLTGDDPAAAQDVAALRPLLGDQVAIGDAIAALRRYSLAKPAGAGTVLVHRLVQHVTRDQLSADDAAAWEQAAAALVAAAVPADPQQPASWPACVVLLPHARALLSLSSAGIWNIARGIGHSGAYAAATGLFREIAAGLEDDPGYGPEHPNALGARAHLARWTGEAGDPAGARDQCAALLPVRQRVSGPEHPDTLADHANIATWTGQAGDPAGARDQYAALLPIFERVLGPDHPDTLGARAHLARWTGEAGDPAGARDQCAALLPVRQRVSGPEHPDTLADHANLADCTGQAVDRAGARDLYAALLPIFERVLGPEHPREPRRLDREGNREPRRPRPLVALSHLGSRNRDTKAARRAACADDRLCSGSVQVPAPAVRASSAAADGDMPVTATSLGSNAELDRTSALDAADCTTGASLPIPGGRPRSGSLWPGWSRRTLRAGPPKRSNSPTTERHLPILRHPRQPDAVRPSARAVRCARRHAPGWLR
jgi:hypothetical protein